MKLAKLVPLTLTRSTSMLFTSCDTEIKFARLVPLAFNTSPLKLSTCEYSSPLVSNNPSSSSWPVKLRLLSNTDKS